MKIYIYAILLFTIIGSCNTSTEKAKTAETAPKEEPSLDMSAYPELFQKALAAHGGLDTWKSFGGLKFDLETTLGDKKKETHLVDLWTRKVRIEGKNYVLGMDGENVWVSPSKEVFGQMSARFYHNLFFYFFAIPPVLADPGTNYEDLGERTIADKTYRALKVSFNQGIGDASDDLYVAHFNPETYEMELLLYTVTYFSGEKHENYNVLIYDWQTVNGLRVPASMKGYKFEDGEIKEQRYNTVFTDVAFTKAQPASTLFDKPENSEIDSLLVRQ